MHRFVLIEELHPQTGDWQTRHICEYLEADFAAIYTADERAMLAAGFKVQRNDRRHTDLLAYHDRREDPQVAALARMPVSRRLHLV